MRPRRYGARSRADWTEEHRRALIGGDFFRVFRDDQTRRDAWSDLRDELLAEWRAKHPGTRPEIWWEYDAPEPRRQRTDGRPHPFESAEREVKVADWRRTNPQVAQENAYKLHRGMPGCLLVEDDFDAEYESQRDYLARHKLLTAAEVRALETAEYDDTPLL